MSVHFASPRLDAQVDFGRDRILAAPTGTALRAYVETATQGDGKPAAIAAILDGKLTELNRPVDRDAVASLVRLDSADGARIYRRSLTFLLIAVANQHFPQARVYVEHSITNGGYYCRIEGRAAFSDLELAQLEAQMRAIVEADLPIVRTELPLSEAIALFEKAGDQEKLALLRQRRKPTLIIYSLLATQDYFHGYMAPSTGYLKYFALEPADGGFLLRFPHQGRPTEIEPTHESGHIYEVFSEYGDWLRALGMRNVAGLNAASAANRLHEVILVTEALHEQRISSIAAQIANQQQQIRVVLVAGPSASGKTTFARRLAVRLLALGIRPLAISIDDYFVDREHTPRDENGEYDFESLYTVDLPFMNQQLNQLIAGEQVQLPRFDFHTGKRMPSLEITISPEHVLIVEGIHALNPKLLPHVNPDLCFRIYVSALTQLNLDRYNRVSTTDTRLIRRIVRDARSRGYSAADTIARWDSVRRGERRWIFPYQYNSDAMFNTALTYELAVLRPLVEPLLRQINPQTLEWIEANRLLALLQWFQPGISDPIPTDSILREFIGGSILEHYRPWALA